MDWATQATAAARARSFHYSFNDYMDLCMWKMQLLGAFCAGLAWARPAAHAGSWQTSGDCSSNTAARSKPVMLRRGKVASQPGWAVMLIPWSPGNRSHDLSGLVAFYVVFDFVTGDILSVYENNSPELLRLYTAHADIFHRAAFDEPGVRLTLPSNKCGVGAGGLEDRRRFVAHRGSACGGRWRRQCARARPV